MQHLMERGYPTLMTKEFLDAMESRLAEITSGPEADSQGEAEDDPMYNAEFEQ